MEQTIEKVVNRKLSFSLEVMDKKTLIESFPVTIESNGKITFQWLRTEDFIWSLMNNSETVSATTVEKSHKTEIRTCLAMKFMYLGMIYHGFDQNLRAEIRKKYEELQRASVDKSILTPVPGMESKRMA